MLRPVREQSSLDLLRCSGYRSFLVVLQKGVTCCKGHQSTVDCLCINLQLALKKDTCHMSCFSFFFRAIFFSVLLE